jgi:hypothetical protein
MRVYVSTYVPNRNRVCIASILTCKRLSFLTSLSICFRYLIAWRIHSSIAQSSRQYDPNHSILVNRTAVNLIGIWTCVCASQCRCRYGCDAIALPRLSLSTKSGVTERVLGSEWTFVRYTLLRCVVAAKRNLFIRHLLRNCRFRLIVVEAFGRPTRIWMCYCSQTHTTSILA